MADGAGLIKVCAKKEELDFQLYLFSLNPYAVEENDTQLVFYFASQNWPEGLGEEVLVNNLSAKREKTKYYWTVRVRILNQPFKPKTARYLHVLKGGAFGTGEHSTTKACITLLIGLSRKIGSLGSVLDFGAGTGILGLIAERIFSCPVFFCEIDPVALFNLNQNIWLNESSGKVVNLTDPFTAELILANVYSQTLVNCASLLLQKKPRWMIASGFRRLEEIKHLLSSFEIIEQIKMGSWLAVLLKTVK